MKDAARIADVDDVKAGGRKAAPQQCPAVSITGGAFSYPGKRVFSGIDIAIPAGSFTALLGPNGCGKTTLLKCMNGILPLAAGMAELQGRETRSMTPGKRARIAGFVFQEHPAPFAYSVMDLVLMGRGPYLGLFSKPGKSDRGRAERALERIGIAGLSERLYSTLSGGERQLALLAKSLVQDPEILFLDEPTSSLDFGNQVRILGILRELSRAEGITIVMTTHMPEHAMAISDMIVLLKDGGILGQGEPLDVVTEENLYALYGVRARIVRIGSAGPDAYAVVPDRNHGSTRSCTNDEI